jgi:hypothetical protein
MSYTQRKDLYKKIEEQRKHSLIAYMTSHRHGATGQMSSDTILEFTRQLGKISKDVKEIDLLIVSLGGDPTASWRIMTMLRDRFKHISVLLPFVAYSAATLIALGADEINMHPFSNLGPVDPQLISPKGSSEHQIQFSSEDLRHFLDFVKTDVGISDQNQLEKAFELVCNEVGSIPIGVAKRSSYLALSMGEKLLNLHMGDPSKAKLIAEKLNKSFFHHGYPLDRREAKEIGLRIQNPDEGLEGLMWKVWEDAAEEMKCNHPFNPLESALSDIAASNALFNIPIIALPSNLPPNMLQQVYQNIMQQITVVNIPAFDYDLFQATLESTHCRSEFHTIGKICVTRKPDFSIAANVVKQTYKWNYFAE